MTLFPYLSICVIFSALVIAMAGSGGKFDKVMPGVLIAVEVLLLLVSKGVLDIPSFSDSESRQYGAAIATIGSFWAFMRTDDKAFPLLAFFASLTQLLAALGVVTA